MTAIQFLEKSKTFSLHQFITVLLSIAALAASARIQIPMIPVPMTLQTGVVLMLPFVLGLPLALATLAGYFMAGAMGLPVFAMAAGAIPGPAYFVGPTGGYLAGFVLAVVCLGMIMTYKKAWSLPLLFVLMVIGHAIILSAGALWLTYGVRVPHAWAVGVAPFLINSLLKSALAAIAVSYLQGRNKVIH